MSNNEIYNKINQIKEKIKLANECTQSIENLNNVVENGLKEE